jgi:hypothetical protein
LNVTVSKTVDVSMRSSCGCPQFVSARVLTARAPALRCRSVLASVAWPASTVPDATVRAGDRRPGGLSSSVSGRKGSGPQPSVAVELPDALAQTPFASRETLRQCRSRIEIVASRRRSSPRTSFFPRWLEIVPPPGARCGRLDRDELDAIVDPSECRLQSLDREPRSDLDMCRSTPPFGFPTGIGFSPSGGRTYYCNPH